MTYRLTREARAQAALKIAVALGPLNDAGRDLAVDAVDAGFDPSVPVDARDPLHEGAELALELRVIVDRLKALRGRLGGGALIPEATSPPPELEARDGRLAAAGKDP